MNNTLQHVFFTLEHKLRDSLFLKSCVCVCVLYSFFLFHVELILGHFVSGEGKPLDVKAVATLSDDWHWLHKAFPNLGRLVHRPFQMFVGLFEGQLPRDLVVHGERGPPKKVAHAFNPIPEIDTLSAGQVAVAVHVTEERSRGWRDVRS